MTPIVNPLIAHRACFYVDDAKLGVRRSSVADVFTLEIYNASQIFSTIILRQTR